jgi:hypothetical protein
MSLSYSNVVTPKDTDRGDNIAEWVAVLIFLSLLLLKGYILFNSF